MELITFEQGNKVLQISNTMFGFSFYIGDKNDLDELGIAPLNGSIMLDELHIAQMIKWFIELNKENQC